jgi:hypothetical protein
VSENNIYILTVKKDKAVQNMLIHYENNMVDRIRELDLLGDKCSDG